MNTETTKRPVVHYLAIQALIFLVALAIALFCAVLVETPTTGWINIKSISIGLLFIIGSMPIAGMYLGNLMASRSYNQSTMAKLGAFLIGTTIGTVFNFLIVVVLYIYFSI